MIDLKDTYDLIDRIVEDNKDKRRKNDRDALLSNGEACLEYTYALIHHAVDQESEYRKFEAELAQTEENGKKVTGAYAETKAKATDYYKEWQRAKQVIELLYHLSNMAKALARSIDSEYKAS